VKRTENMERLRSFLGMSSQALFRSVLKRRNYEGSLDFDHDNKLLEIRMRPDRSREERATVQLSGGERSFATISFLAAMWESIENPFRALDEFDVFMVRRTPAHGACRRGACTDARRAGGAARAQDAVNRKIATRVIIDSAAHNPSRQFILITPLELTYVTALSRSAWAIASLPLTHRPCRSEAAATDVHVIRLDAHR
jgi:structural maintenance of chromosomes protein 6